VMLPAMLTAWAVVLRKPVLRASWPSWIALAVYLGVRSRTAAYTPTTSPWFYQFTFNPLDLLTNIGEYLDRACTFAAIVVVLCALLGWSRPRWTPEIRRIAFLALIWLIGGYALTVFLPVRSSLYACLPAAGIAILAAAIVTTSLPPRPRVMFAIALPIVLLPVYWSRNERWVELADLGADTFATVRQIARETPEARHLVFKDDRDTRRSILNTYGTLLPPAVTLAAGRAIPVWLDPPPDDWQGSELSPVPVAVPPATPARVATVQLQDGRLVRLP
jgi:hypothetical protein